LDFSIATTANPTISHYFQSPTAWVWIGAAYLLPAGAVAPVWARLSDIFGRKPVVLTTIAIFGLGSALCASANSVSMLIAGRAVQGTAAGGIIVLVNITISDLFSMRYDEAAYLCTNDLLT
jgi:MFS family permease